METREAVKVLARAFWRGLLAIVVWIASHVVWLALCWLWEVTKVASRNVACFYRKLVGRIGWFNVIIYHLTMIVIFLLLLGVWGDQPGRLRVKTEQPAKEQVAPATALDPTDTKPEETPTPAEEKDTSPKGALGKGAWIIELDEAELGQVKQIKDPAARQSAQVEAIVAKAKMNGLGHIIVKTAHFGRPYRSCPAEMARELGEACRKAGIRCFGYGRILADDALAEAEMAKLAMRPARDGGMGLGGYVFDAEGEAKGKDENLRLILSDVKSWLKATAPNKRLAYSSFGIHGLHRGLAWDTLNEFCHYAMPQLYWRSWQESQEWTLDESLRRSLSSWSDCPLPVVPTVQSYSGKVGGVARVEPAKMKKFLAGLDTSMGFNAFRWDYTGPEQWQVIRDFKCGKPSYKLKDPVAPKKAEKASAAPTTMPKMPLEPTGKGDLTGMVVVIDPGHGGPDGGCTWTTPGGVKFLEASLTYMMSWELAELVRQRGATVYLTAFDPVMYHRPATAQEKIPKPSKAKLSTSGSMVCPGLKTHQNRVGTARVALKKFGTSGFKIAWVSIHVDSTGGRLEGVHVLRKLSGSNPLADAIGKELKDSKIAWNHKKVPVVFTSTKSSENRPGEKESVYVLDSNPLRLVALVETGFPRASGRDSWRLRSPEHRQKIVDAIANGLAAVNE